MRHVVLLALSILLASCSDAPGGGGGADPLASDPVVARALHDPLMSDPDLSARNAANALLGFADDTALPLIPPRPGRHRQRARRGGSNCLPKGKLCRCLRLWPKAGRSCAPGRQRAICSPRSKRPNPAPPP